MRIDSDLLLVANPNLGKLQSNYKNAKFVDEPYSQTISAGKNTYVYDAHTYHTKVPPQGISALIEYYTRLGDVVLDPFCGSGMTGVAATQLCRQAMLCDISPAAVFIAANLNTPIDSAKYLSAVQKILESAKDLEQSLYNTHCRLCGKSTPMIYMVWSYGMVCSHCNHEFVLWDVARDERPRTRDSKILAEFPCPHCGISLKKRQLKRTKRYPVSVGYKCCVRGLKENTSNLDEHDHLRLQNIIEKWPSVNLWHPINPFPHGINTKQPLAAGIDSVDKCYTPRALWAMAYLWEQALHWPDEEVRPKLLWTLTSLYQRVTVFSEFRFWGGSGNTANYYVPAIMNEQNVFKAFARKASTISWYFKSAPSHRGPVSFSTQSACHLPQIADSSVDYVFTDPPFGSNINYSEMNFLWESWLGAHTNTTEEAVVHPLQNKGIAEYRELLSRAFTEIYRVLKNNGWMTVVFHNSSEHVWRALQGAIERAGFAIQGTQTFDKEHGTFKQFVSQNSVGYDLVLHCRKAAYVSQQPIEESQCSRTDVMSFVRRALTDHPTDYIVRFLHVDRKEEFDFRRLYADWLAQSLIHSPVEIGFEEFRRSATGIMEEMMSLLKIEGQIALEL